MPSPRRTIPFSSSSSSPMRTLPSNYIAQPVSPVTCLTWATATNTWLAMLTRTHPRTPAGTLAKHPLIGQWCSVRTPPAFTFIALHAPSARGLKNVSHSTVRVSPQAKTGRSRLSLQPAAAPDQRLDGTMSLQVPWRAEESGGVRYPTCLLLGSRPPCFTLAIVLSGSCLLHLLDPIVLTSSAPTSIMTLWTERPCRCHCRASLGHLSSSKTSIAYRTNPTAGRTPPSTSAIASKTCTSTSGQRDASISRRMTGGSSGLRAASPPSGPKPKQRMKSTPTFS